MDNNGLRNLIKDFVEKNNPYEREYIDYDTYLSLNSATEPLLQGMDRSLTDIVNLVVWTTDQDSFQNLIFLPMSGSLQMHACKIKYTSGTLNHIHSHNYTELTYVLQGTLLQKIEGKNVTVEEGEICLINSHVSHGEYLSPTDCIILFLQIDDIFFEKYASEEYKNDFTLGLKKLINRKRGQSFYIKFRPFTPMPTQTNIAFLTILTELINDLPGKKRLVLGYVERIVDLLTKEYHICASSDDRQDFHRALVMDIREYISHHYQHVTVQEISANYHYSPDYINRVFSRQMHIPVSTYIQQIRLRHSLDLIKSSNLTMEQICCQVGYHNIGFFYKKFKEQYGTTPAAVRNEHFSHHPIS